MYKALGAWFCTVGKRWECVKGVEGDLTIDEAIRYFQARKLIN
jgi:hypothetical protein